jgi:hypothetical protein
VETRYTQDLMFARYRELYQWALRDPQGAAPGVG